MRAAARPACALPAERPTASGATVGFSTSGAQVEFLANPPALTNGILPYAFVGPP